MSKKVVDILVVEDFSGTSIDVSDLVALGVLPSGSQGNSMGLDKDTEVRISKVHIPFWTRDEEEEGVLGIHVAVRELVLAES